jgi:pathogenesis-related protein 1
MSTFTDRNTARAELGIAPLTWDSNVANDAQQYANQLASTDSGLQHSQQLGQQGQGENLASLTGHWPSPHIESSKIWYAEKKEWNGGVVQARRYASN